MAWTMLAPISVRIKSVADVRPATAVPSHAAAVGGCAGQARQEPTSIPCDSDDASRYISCEAPFLRFDEGFFEFWSAQVRDSVQTDGYGFQC